ncbi:MAG: tetratricopeptide repeat protein [Acidobacteriia bacterium]|nr:tetratricopeptide repeat protein [Terriglobia bacterium]
MAEPPVARSKDAEGVPDLTGMTVGRFAIRARLGVGGMGEVYRADDTKPKRAVALKRIAPRLRTDPNFRQRFLKEAERVSALSDQRIAGVYDVLEEEGETFLVMEFVEGSTLRERLGRPLSLEEFLPVALQCAEALVAAHEKGIVHRDIKPENIMLTPRGQVKILDFGVAKRLPRADEGTGTGSTVGGPAALSGTPAYMAPEVLLAGKHPFRVESLVQTCDHILHAAPAALSQFNPKVSARLEHLVGKMLEKDPKNRPASTSEVLVELRAVERDETSLALLPGRAAARRRRWAGVMVAVLLLVALVLAGLSPPVRREVRRWLGFPTVPQKKNLAVLPFTVLGGPQESAAFANGLTETVTARLTQLTQRHPLQVIPAGEVRAQKVRTLDEARQEFGVNLVIEGSLQQAGKMARASYALVDATTRRQLRADTITAAMADPFAMEDRVVESVLSNLEIELQPQEREALAAHGTTQPSAYEFYLRGRGYLQEYQKPENVESAINVFRRALELDPQYARAAAGLGEAYWKKYENRKEPGLVEAARQACSHATSLDSKLADAHVCLGTLHNGTGQYEQAVGDFQAALSQEPTRDDAYRGLAAAYQHLGKLGEAEETYQRAINLRPQYWAGYSWLGNFYFLTGKYVKAEQTFKQMVEVAPENYRGYANVAVTEYMLGSWAEAEQAYRKSIALHESSDTYSNLGALYFFQGRYADAARTFEAGVRLSPRNPIVRGNLADAYRWIPGEAKRAEESYRQAIELGEQELQVNPRDAEIGANLALWRAKSGSPAEAVRDIQRALALAPADPRYMYYGAVVYKLAGHRSRALEWLKKSVVHGYPVQEIRADPEMRDLHDNPVYQKIVGTVQQ